MRDILEVFVLFFHRDINRFVVYLSCRIRVNFCLKNLKETGNLLSDLRPIYSIVLS